MKAKRTTIPNNKIILDIIFLNDINFSLSNIKDFDLYLKVYDIIYLIRYEV